jgi:hypothetical protein
VRPARYGRENNGSIAKLGTDKLLFRRCYPAVLSLLSAAVFREKTIGFIELAKRVKKSRCDQR